MLVWIGVCRHHKFNQQHFMKPPDIITRYFNAANAGLIDEATLCFSPDATVEDEGNTHTGSRPIRVWIDSTTRKYRPQTEVLHVGEKDGTMWVTGRVSGNFPGSPVELDYQFTLAGETISHLSIL